MATTMCFAEPVPVCMHVHVGWSDFVFGCVCGVPSETIFQAGLSVATDIAVDVVALVLEVGGAHTRHHHFNVCFEVDFRLNAYAAALMFYGFRFRMDGQWVNGRDG